MSKAQELVAKIESTSRDPKATDAIIDGLLNEMVSLLNKEPEAWDLCTDKVRFLLSERFCYTGPMSFGSYR
ncbi:MAG TPA: hypothetical protein DEP01_03955 [Aminobacterium sp.]|jgi:hypothetical protein|uniref:hypothetical protein n=1 Tax=Aminobacterium TaxID=81466 RepID=UPI000ED866E2|nr:hypothetical protein [Aminobacterium sp. UBA4834]HCA40725.1 hypothetical protein [Aminobacterium sp.]